METKEIHTLIILFTKVDKTISNLLMRNALNQLGYINAKIVDSNNTAIYYYGQLNSVQRDKFNEYAEAHQCSTFYIEFDPNLVDSALNVGTVKYE